MFYTSMHKINHLSSISGYWLDLSWLTRWCMLGWDLKVISLLVFTISWNLFLLQYMPNLSYQLCCTSGYPTLSPKVEEGICQVLAHMWLDSETVAGSASNVASTSSSSSSSLSSSSASSSSNSTPSGSSKKGKRSEFEKELGEFFKHQIESSTSAAYGDGFREGNEAVLKYGLKRTLDHIRLTGCFPWMIIDESFWHILLYISMPGLFILVA